MENDALLDETEVRVNTEGAEERATIDGRAGERLYKRPFDLAVLVLAHLLLLPLWAFLWVVIPLVILLDDGRPVFYRQRRMGKGSKVFTALKFRTMVRDADMMGPAWTARDDPRLTRVGRILRGTALDELPQVLNILRGEMSFVGPRALAVDEVVHLLAGAPDFQQRLASRPGLTGLAQVYTDRDDAQEKLKHDMEYARCMGLWLDVKLLFLSVWISARGKWESRSKKL